MDRNEFYLWPPWLETHLDDMRPPLMAFFKIRTAATSNITKLIYYIFKKKIFTELFEFSKANKNFGSLLGVPKYSGDY